VMRYAHRNHPLGSRQVSAVKGWTLLGKQETSDSEFPSRSEFRHRQA
jgi:hypothetical protein